MDNLYFKEYYKLERNHWWFTARSLILNDQIKNICKGKDLKILNIGVATGATSEMLATFGTVTSVEFDNDCCNFLRNDLKMDVTEASITDLPFVNESYDLVCAFDVVEHVENDRLAVNEMKRVCKINGHILSTVPAFNFLWSKHDEVNHHFRRYSENQYCNLYISSGTILFKSYFNCLLFLPVLVFRVISKFLPTNFMRKGAGSDFTISGSNTFAPLLFHIFATERIWLNRKISCPFGISFLLLWTKK